MTDLSPHGPVTLSALPTRHFLFLQGLMGPFFERIGAALRRDGYAVSKVNFNGGDKLFWGLPGGLDYRGTLDDWPGALRAIIAEHGITDVLLFGDCRPHHELARAVCRDLHIPVHVFEEGYLRPDWVTLELGGVNGHSRLPRDPEYYRVEAALLPPVPPHRPVPSSFRRRAAEGIAYNAADILLRWYFPHWTNHRPWHPIVEGMGWLKRLRRRKAVARRSEETLRRLRASGAPYMLFPLQLDADAQVRLHSSFDGMQSAIEHVITSFAAHAPKDMRLIVKQHPLDNGMKDWRQIVGRCARAHGVLGRVGFVETGDIALLVRDARGVVTINSTTGTLALAANVPVITLGQAVYDIPGITYCGSLRLFWNDPGHPDEALFAAFRRVLIEYCLVPGGFFSEEGLDKLTRSVVARLERHSPKLFDALRTSEGLDAWHCMSDPLLHLSSRVAVAVGATE
ncbi:capsular biosynthesis protein [Ameyamaea chiangmaiensis]|uniref:Capsular biosynthesis protein n=2 Tax=Ameyamaea chiangmaiensis TaxID=442969 RepID=A0A850PAF3_9PROT|nr:capsular biosynthesis protein [Ameyamaea chiangmaiensis]MBS4075329.1 capsular biosynthesis protein [Ameyamaea chiangmaiensis]NVN41535.1 capsular biosynthesis protein [Ameyamaea chiangmaiensis]